MVSKDQQELASMQKKNDVVSNDLEQKKKLKTK